MHHVQPAPQLFRRLPLLHDTPHQQPLRRHPPPARPLADSLALACVTHPPGTSRRAKRAVAGVAQPRHDVAARVQVCINHGGVHRQARVLFAQHLERGRRAHHAAGRAGGRSVGCGWSHKTGPRASPTAHESSGSPRRQALPYAPDHTDHVGRRAALQDVCQHLVQRAAWRGRRERAVSRAGQGGASLWAGASQPAVRRKLASRSATRLFPFPPAHPPVASMGSATSTRSVGEKLGGSLFR